jgi:deoxycytidylate deaminase
MCMLLDLTVRVITHCPQVNCGELLAAAGVGKILRALDASTDDYDLMERLLRVVYALASVEAAVQVCSRSSSPTRGVKQPG